MEFFRIVDIAINETEIQEKIQNHILSDIYSDIIVLDANLELVKIGCIWGDFTLRRDKIKGGIRYSMLECPNALAWTITSGYPPARDKVVLHLTINRENKKKEFVDEINEFLDGWKMGLTAFFEETVKL